MKLAPTRVQSVICCKDLFVNYSVFYCNGISATLSCLRRWLHSIWNLEVDFKILATKSSDLYLISVTKWHSPTRVESVVIHACRNIFFSQFLLDCLKTFWLILPNKGKNTKARCFNRQEWQVIKFSHRFGLPEVERRLLLKENLENLQ